MDYEDIQSPSMETLAFERSTRLLKTQGKISETWFSNDAVRIRCWFRRRQTKENHPRAGCKTYTISSLISMSMASLCTFDLDFYQRIEEDREIGR